MVIEVKPSSVGCDVRCAVCGQAFLLFSSRLAHLHHHAVQAYVQGALREHHTGCDDGSAHPAGGFCMTLLPAMLGPAPPLHPDELQRHNAL